MNRQNISRWLLIATAISCVFQLYCFGSNSIHQIAIDDTSYLGIARHLRDRQFYAAIHDFRSPLISWMVAAGSFFQSDYVLVGKVFGIGSYLLCVVLLYLLSRSLMHSGFAASVAVFWFSLCRGLAAAAVAMVAPDLLLTALVLGFFLVLLECLRSDKKGYWCLLGGIHALAFLAKAFALPLLTLCTICAVVLARPRRQWLSRLVLAAVLPALAAGGWAGVLHSNTASLRPELNFKVNFFQWTDKSAAAHIGDYFVPRDTKPFIDEHDVVDPMPPGSAAWRSSVNIRQAAPSLLANEVYNLPRALKEIAILVTPGVCWRSWSYSDTPAGAGRRVGRSSPS
jgi:4-amino-4-deoxy-L-arabinose transferase-like glycosyltransferase